MGIEEQHIWRGPEDILGSIAMVNIPVNDQYPLAAKLGLGVGCGHRNVIEQAETSRTYRIRMVARGMAKSESAVGTTASTAAMAEPAATSAAATLPGETAVVSTSSHACLPRRA